MSEADYDTVREGIVYLYNYTTPPSPGRSQCKEDTLAALASIEAREERLREALKQMSERAQDLDAWLADQPDKVPPTARLVTRDMLSIYRAALWGTAVTIDPFCLHHGLRMSEHPTGWCLFCCICFDALEPDECYRDVKGVKHDVCKNPNCVREAFGEQP